MPIPASSPLNSAEKACSTKPPAGVSLPVLPDPKHTVRKSRMGPWRAAVLILVNLAIAGHVALWLLTGMRETLAPVEPSEAMYTLERGLVNAGFVFFVLAILSTLVLGRFFCGWGCHVVALQDLCGWMMKKLGVRPKPFRTRLLIAAPLLLALYMFVWPTFKREVVRPLAEATGTLAAIGPYLGDVPPPVFHSKETASAFFQPAFKKKDFWETFAPWYMVVPFLGVCGFAIVYFLGSKAFCSYGCPYGGFFAPVDKLAPGRIRVTDACEGCGHCTAVCTSNVRVHEEVRDYGMVMDPGCMKCLDCVSVCPNDALYFGFGAPAAFAKPRTPKEDRKARFKSRVYDLSLREELLYGLLFFVLIVGYTDMLNEIPLLMAMAMAAIGAFLAWKTVSLLRTPNVRIQSLQLKLKGRIKPWGVAFAALALLVVGTGLWGTLINLSLWYGGTLDSRIHTPAETVFAPGYTPAPADRDLAVRSIAHLTRGGPPRDGGIGWHYENPDRYIRLAWLNAVAGRLPEAEANIRKGIAFAVRFPEGPNDDLLEGLGNTMSLQGRTPDDITRAYRELRDSARGQPGAAPLILVGANIELAGGNATAAGEQAQEAVKSTDQPRVLTAAAQILMQTGRPADAVAAARRAVDLEPRHAGARAFLSAILAAAGQPEEALIQLDEAARLDPKAPRPLRMKAELLRQMGRAGEAAAADQKAAELESATPRR